MVSMSLEKRLRMRPIGVTSKKAMGDLMMLRRRELCTSALALMVPWIEINIASSTKIAAEGEARKNLKQLFQKAESPFSEKNPL